MQVQQCLLTDIMPSTLQSLVALKPLLFHLAQVLTNTEAHDLLRSCMLSVCSVTAMQWALRMSTVQPRLESQDNTCAPDEASTAKRQWTACSLQLFFIYCTLAGEAMCAIKSVTSLHIWSAGDESCFPLHYDSDETVDNRRITAILYLNPDWEQGDGGELKLYPWPREPVTVEPLHNRLLLFSTCRMLHRSTLSLAHAPVSIGLELLRTVLEQKLRWK